MILIGDLAPALARPEVGHRHIAVDLGNHLGQLDLVGNRLEQLENSGTADDGDRRVRRGGNRAVDVMDDIDALDLPYGIITI